MDKMREEFEAWYSEFYTPQDASDIWQPIIKSMALKAWQASRQALVVEFTTDTYFSPCKTEKELARDEGFDSAMKDVKAALDLAGIKYE